MGLLFSGSELVKIAIGIEKNGLAYYETLAESASNDAAVKIFRHLADQERMHVKVFGEMLSSVSDYTPQEGITEEYGEYMKALTDSAVFKNEDAAREMARKAGNTIEAVNIGLRAEKDSILFYLEMHELVRPSEREVVDRIIEEEKVHMRELTNIKNNVGL